MFLHVGADVVVRVKRVIGIFDLRTSGGAEATRQFLASVTSRLPVTDVAGAEPKSLVLTDTEVFLSPISSVTLKRRAETAGTSLVTDLSAT